MCVNRSYIIVSLCLFIVLMTGCASSIAPKGWLPNPQEVQSQAFGAWMAIEHGSEAGTKISNGELIAVQERNVYLLTMDGPEVISIDKVQNAKLALYKEKRRVGLWAIIGTLSTLSHGWGLIFTAPTWIIVGIASASGESKSGLLKYSDSSWDEIKKYARFPQGIPRSINLESLRPKKWYMYMKRHL